MAYTTIDDPSAYFQAKTYTGTGSSLAITNDGNSNLQPDLVWLKRRDGSTYDHRWNDSVRGVSKTIYSSDNFAENTSDNDLVLGCEVYLDACLEMLRNQNEQIARNNKTLITTIITTAGTIMAGLLSTIVVLIIN